MTIYDIFFFGFAIVYLPYLIIKGKAHKDFTQRFGRLPHVLKEISAERPIWVHAVSVGEVQAVKDFVKRLSEKFPEQKIIFSTTTKTGNAVAGKILSKDVLKFYFPLDFSFVARRVVNFVNPSILVIMETEIWPNLILELSRRKIPIALINGRISDRSFKGYEKIKFVFGKLLRKMSLFCMQTARDARKIEELGALKDSIRVTGNMKFDIGGVHPAGGFVSNATKMREGIIRTRSDLGIGEADNLLIAGSTHGGEEEILLDAYRRLARKFESLRLLIAPRHIDRAETIKKLAEQKGFSAVLISMVRTSPKPGMEAVKTTSIPGLGEVTKPRVLILDTLGELSRLYRLATIVFMGGSLVKKGGHNMVEPAIFGRPIVFGPYMFNFTDMAKSFLENTAAMEVKDRKALPEILEALLEDEDKRKTLGRNAKNLIDRAKGATERNIRELEKLIENEN